MSNAKKRLAILGLASAMIFAGSAFAQAGSEAGWYVGASLGQSQVDVDCSGTTTCDDKDSAWKIFGGYQFNRNFSVELGYTDLAA
jgi:OOP family OmpA-OmpF porin